MDTGACESLVGGAMVKALGLEIRSPGLDRPDECLRSASGEYMRISGTVDVRMTYRNGVTHRWTCYVVPAFSHGLLLGTDYLDAHNAAISFGRRAMTADGFCDDWVPMTCSLDATGSLVVDSDQEVPVNGSAFVTVRAGVLVSPG